ncbi:hypothetical protein FRC07_005259 [Ceratobasidium sp. 392]|nr:hypothetical protein FRC07_005259 [Ceratobasidium sp. 392]
MSTPQNTSNTNTAAPGQSTSPAPPTSPLTGSLYGFIVNDTATDVAPPSPPSSLNLALTGFQQVLPAPDNAEGEN